MGSSALIFNTFDTRIVNPLSINMEGGVFPPAIYARWPGLMRTLGGIYAALAVCGALLQRNPSSFQGERAAAVLGFHGVHDGDIHRDGVAHDGGDLPLKVDLIGRGRPPPLPHVQRWGYGCTKYSCDSPSCCMFQDTYIPQLRPYSRETLAYL